jgi:hypothetical protein
MSPLPEWFEPAADEMSDPLNQLLRAEDEEFEPTNEQLSTQYQVVVHSIIASSDKEEALRGRFDRSPSRPRRTTSA